MQNKIQILSCCSLYVWYDIRNCYESAGKGFMFNQSIVFEQPVNELIRVCLRIEHLLMTANAGIKGDEIYDTRSAISALIDILLLTDRPDLRGKLTKEFIRQRSNLQRFINQPGVDDIKLETSLFDLEKYTKILQDHSGKFGGNLRENEFLNSIRQHLSMSGGAIGFDTPAYFYWLQKPIRERHEQIALWLNEFDDLAQCVQFILRLVRKSNQPTLYTAYEGFFQTSLDPQIPCQLIRVIIPRDLPVFPEISVGRHGVGIRFYHPTIKERPVPYEKDVGFYLICCVL